MWVAKFALTEQLPLEWEECAAAAHHVGGARPLHPPLSSSSAAAAASASASAYAVVTVAVDEFLIVTLAFLCVKKINRFQKKVKRQKQHQHE